MNKSSVQNYTFKIDLQKKCCENMLARKFTHNSDTSNSPSVCYYHSCFTGTVGLIQILNKVATHATKAFKSNHIVLCCIVADTVVIKYRIATLKIDIIVYPMEEVYINTTNNKSILYLLLIKFNLYMITFNNKSAQHHHLSLLALLSITTQYY